MTKGESIRKRSFWGCSVLVGAVFALAAGAIWILALSDDWPPKKQSVTLAGTVTLNGSPVGAGTIVVLRSSWPILRDLASVSTDATGAYQIEFESRRADFDGHAVFVQIPQALDTALVFSARLPNSSTAKNMITLNLNEQYQAGALALAVTVQDRLGKPFSNQAVEIHAADRSYYLVKELDENGYLRFDELKAGHYHIQSLLPSRKLGPVAYLLDSRKTFASGDVKISEAAPASSVILVPGGNGAESIAGTIRINGTPLPSLPVELTYKYGAYWSSHVPGHSSSVDEYQWELSTEADGSFSYDHLVAVDARIEWEQRTTDRNLVVQRQLHSTERNLDFNLVATASIDGRVSPPQHGVISIGLRLVAGDDESDIDRFSAFAKTTSAGEFSFQDLPAGEYQVSQLIGRGEKPPYTVQSESVTLTVDNESVVTLKVP